MKTLRIVQELSKIEDTICDIDDLLDISDNTTEEVRYHLEQIDDSITTIYRLMEID